MGAAVHFEDAEDITIAGAQFTNCGPAISGFRVRRIHISDLSVTEEVMPGDVESLLKAFEALGVPSAEAAKAVSVGSTGSRDARRARLRRWALEFSEQVAAGSVSTLVVGNLPQLEAVLNRFLA